MNIIEEIESLKQALHTMRLTNDITPDGKKALELGLDVLIERVKNNLVQSDVSGRSELLSAFSWVSSIGEQFFDSGKTVEDMVDSYLKSRQ